MHELRAVGEVLDHLGEMVVKAVDESGGYGMLMGPQASVAEREEFRKRIEADPRKYIAQPLIELSTCPTWAWTAVHVQAQTSRARMSISCSLARRIFSPATSAWMLTSR